MVWWISALQRTGITYTFTFHPPYGTSMDTIRRVLYRAGLHLFLLRHNDEGSSTLICLRRHTFHVALILAALHCSFPPPPLNVTRRPSRRWGERALHPLHLPRDTMNMLLDAYTSPVP